MLRWFLRTIHDAGPRRAVENARREADQTARAFAQIAALEARLTAVAAATRRAA